MKKFLALLLAAVLLIMVLAGCGGSKGEEAEAPAKTSEETTEDTQETQDVEEAEDSEDAEASEDTADSGEKPYIAVISKGFQHQFWQVVLKGAEDAAKEYNVEITFEGPPSESDISEQVDMLNNALSKNPDAICLAALDTESVLSQLEEAKKRGIPVIGFDSGVPNAPEGSIVSTAATNNYEAGRLAAEEMFNHPEFNEKLKAATADNPVAIAVQSQDATSASILDRTNGFIDAMVEMCEELFPGGVEVVGHDVFKRPAEGDVVVSIKVTIPPSSSYTDAQAAAQTMLSNTKNLIGYYMTNEASVTGVLAATSDGTDFDRENGKYKDIVAIGFDAGSTQKNAVANQYFYGSVTQDPYMIGYKAIEIAYKVINGEEVEEVVDTGAKFYTHENMNDEDIAPLLYD